MTIGQAERLQPVPESKKEDTSSPRKRFSGFKGLYERIEQANQSRRDKYLEKKLQKRRIPGRETFIHEYDNDITQLSKEEWHEFLEQSGFKEKELEYASDLMAAFGQGMADTIEYHNGKSRIFKYASPNFAFSSGFDLHAVQLPGTVILSWEFLHGMARHAVETENKAEKFPGSDESITFEGTPVDYFYYVGVEETDHEIFGNQHPFRAMRAGDHKGPINQYDAIPVEYRALQTKIALPRTQELPEAKRVFEQRLSAADAYRKKRK